MKQSVPVKFPTKELSTVHLVKFELTIVDVDIIELSNVELETVESVIVVVPVRNAIAPEVVASDA